MKSVQFAVMFLGLLAMVQQSKQLSFKYPLRAAIDRVSVNSRTGPSIALVLASDINERALNESNAFTAGSVVDVAGRRFHLGTIDNVDVIYVKGGARTINTAITVQILLNTFEIRGIVQVGNAGGLTDELSVGDVSVPGEIAYTGNWKWENFNSREAKGPLKFGQYNYPQAGRNYLQSILFKPLDLFPSDPNGNAQQVFWIQPDAYFLDVARRLESLKRERCGINTNCLSQTSNIVVGLRASSADVYVANEAYGRFLNRQFESSTVDTNSASLGFAALTNGVPFIAFRGISDKVVGSGADNSNLASVNAVNAAVQFVRLLPQPRVSGY